MEHGQQDLYTARQVASICKVTLRRVVKWLKDGDIPGVDTEDGVNISREALLRFMTARELDLSRLPRSAAAVAAQRAADAQAAIVRPEVQAALRRVAALEAYVKELRTKLFYRDRFIVVEPTRVTERERTAVDTENAAAKLRWDAETDRQLAAIAGMK